jgi:hypothetical protein
MKVLALKRCDPKEVDRSRTGSLVHSADSFGCEVIVVTHIETFTGREPRYAKQERLLCRSTAQARKIAQLLREATFDEKSGQSPRNGLSLLGWECRHCRVFNCEERERREDCRSCGEKR